MRPVCCSPKAINLSGDGIEERYMSLALLGTSIAVFSSLYKFWLGTVGRFEFETNHLQVSTETFTRFSIQSIVSNSCVHWPSRPEVTVKAPNFGQHGNFGPLKRVLQKNDENKSCRRTLDLQNSVLFNFVPTWFIHRSYRVSKKKSSFHEVQS